MAYQHLIDSERCKGCGLCINFCPKNILKITGKTNAKGHCPVHQARPGDYIHYAICCVMCPDVAISIVEKKTA